MILGRSCGGTTITAKDQNLRLKSNTARLDDLQRTSDDKLISMFRRDDKRKKIKRFLKDKEMFYEIDERASVKKLIEMFDATIKRSNGGISERAKSELKFLLEFAQSTETPDSGWLVVVKSKKHEEIAGYQLVLSSKDTAYAVAQCSSDFYRDSDLNIFLTYKSITMARDFGFDSFDFNGANSPNRADDKHAFGAAAQPYFELIYDGK